MKGTLIVCTSLLFCAIGVLVSFMAIHSLRTHSNGQGPDEDTILAISLAPAPVGAIIGLVIGIVAAKFSKRSDSPGGGH